MSARTRRVITLTTASAALLTALAITPQALAASAPPVQRSTTTGEAGYIASGSGLTSVSSTWVQPSITCTSSDVDLAFTVGLEGGELSSLLGIESDCSGGSPEYAGWFELYPAAPVYFSNPVGPGDLISASITGTGGNGFTLAMTDSTKGWTQTLKKTMDAAQIDSAEILVESPTEEFPTAGSVTFDNCLVDGVALGSFSPEKVGNPSDLTNGGRRFSVTF